MKNKLKRPRFFTAFYLLFACTMLWLCVFLLFSDLGFYFGTKYNAWFGMAAAVVIAVPAYVAIGAITKIRWPHVASLVLLLLGSLTSIFADSLVAAQCVAPVWDIFGPYARPCTWVQIGWLGFLTLIMWVGAAAVLVNAEKLLSRPRR